MARRQDWPGSKHGRRRRGQDKRPAMAKPTARCVARQGLFSLADFRTRWFAPRLCLRLCLSPPISRAVIRAQADSASALPKRARNVCGPRLLLSASGFVGRRCLGSSKTTQEMIRRAQPRPGGFGADLPAFWRADLRFLPVSLCNAASFSHSRCRVSFATLSCSPSHSCCSLCLLFVPSLISAPRFHTRPLSLSGALSRVLLARTLQSTGDTEHSVGMPPARAPGRDKRGWQQNATVIAAVLSPLRVPLVGQACFSVFCGLCLAWPGPAPSGAGGCADGMRCWVLFQGGSIRVRCLSVDVGRVPGGLLVEGTEALLWAVLCPRLVLPPGSAIAPRETQPRKITEWVDGGVGT